MNGTYLVVLMLGLVSALYAASVAGYLFAGRPGMALTFAGYVIANIGLIWDALR